MKTTKEINSEQRDLGFKYVWSLAFNLGNIKSFLTYEIPESKILRRWFNNIFYNNLFLIESNPYPMVIYIILS